MSTKWKTIKEFTDIKYESGINHTAGIAKITINRPEVRNAFRPQTVFELKEAFTLAREDQSIGVIILTGEGPEAFCSGGDQKIRGDKGYIGEDITQLEHAMQAALLAEKENCSSDVVLAAFLHDIGHLIALEKKTIVIKIISK